MTRFYSLKIHYNAVAVSTAGVECANVLPVKILCVFITVTELQECAIGDITFLFPENF